MTTPDDIRWADIHRILFVCHGNICRSSMAHCLMAKLLLDENITDVTVDSAATSTEEIGNPIHYGARQELLRHGIPILTHRARQLRADDAQKYDLFLGADTANVANMRRILPTDAADKCLLMMDLVGEHRGIADPWYTDNFQETWNDVLRGCLALLAHLKEARNNP